MVIWLFVSLCWGAYQTGWLLQAYKDVGRRFWWVLPIEQAIMDETSINNAALQRDLALPIRLSLYLSPWCREWCLLLALRMLPSYQESICPYALILDETEGEEPSNSGSASDCQRKGIMCILLKKDLDLSQRKVALVM